jgi:serine/threonine protein kinase
VSDGVPADTGGFRIGFPAGLDVAGYRVDREIGRGGTAVVYRARDERLGRLVALKILTPELGDDETFLHWSIQQFRSVAAVRNPHIIPVFEAGQVDGMLFVAMRYVPSGDARSLARREGSLPPGRIAVIIWQAASALDAMHAAGLLHGDVKPTNMLVDAASGWPDRVYLSDFGLSRGTVSVAGPSRAGLSLNTLACIAPELIEGDRADGRADQYALAAAAFELFTGWPPFRPDDAATLLHAHVTEPPPRLTAHRPELPSAVDAVLVRALAKDPDHRYPSCGEFAGALAEALGLRPPGPGPDPDQQADTGPIPLADQPAAIQTRSAYLAGPGVAPTADAPGSTEVSPPAPGAPSAGAPSPGAPASGAPASGPPGGGEEPWLVRRRPRTRVPLAGVVIGLVVLLVVAGVVVTATGALRSPAPKPKPLPRLASFPIAAASALPALSGDVRVIYDSGATARARVYGEVKGAGRGYIAWLYAQPFPYKFAPTPVAAITLRPRRKLAPYAFGVTPSLATRYHVEVFPNRTARKSLGSSPTTTVYVTTGILRGTSQTCARPTCHQTISVDVFVPTSAIHAEISKPWYTYFGLTLSKSPAKPPAAPTVLQLGAGNPVTSVRAVSANEFAVTLKFEFKINNDGYIWMWAACGQDSVAADGLGVPGSYGCGDKTIPALTSYLG